MIQTVVAIVVTTIWAINYAIEIFNTHYHVPAEISGIMAVVAGYFFANGMGERTRRQAREEARREVHDEELEQELRQLRKESDVPRD